MDVSLIFIMIVKSYFNTFDTVCSLRGMGRETQTEIDLDNRRTFFKSAASLKMYEMVFSYLERVAKLLSEGSVGAK